MKTKDVSMAVQVKLSSIPESKHSQILEDLTVTPIDVTYEQMKKIGRILPGYVPKTDTSVSVYGIDVDATGEKILTLPYRYAKQTFGLSNDSIEHRRIPGIPETIKYAIDLREGQCDYAVQCFEHLEDFGTTIVGLPPGFGKTFIGSWLAYHMELLTIVIAPRTPLLDQWKKTFNTAIPDLKVWIVGDNDKEFDLARPPMEPGTLQVKSILPDVIICLDPRIEKIPEHIRRMIGTLIIDEAHMIATPSRIQGLLSIFPKYVILETATLKREDGMHKICNLIAGEEGVFVTAQDPYTLFDVQLPFIEGKEESTQMGVSYTALNTSLAENETYNQVIIGIVKANKERKFILLTRLVKHATVLKKLLEANGITCDTLVGSKKKYSDSKVLIGTFQKIGVGFDEATASATFAGIKSDTLILCHSVKNIQNFEQFRGRVMRVANPQVYWLTPNNKMIKRHLYGLKDWIGKTNGKIVKVDGRQYL